MRVIAGITTCKYTGACRTRLSSPLIVSSSPKMAEPNLKARKRSDYVYFLAYRTRWSVSIKLKERLPNSSNRSDNDQYSHINNSIYYHLFDSIVNTYLIEKCGLDPKSSPLIGLVVSSYCQVWPSQSVP